MDRRHFQLDQGYLNIDTESLVFNRSGNWQEAARVGERSAKFSVGSSIHILIGAALILVGGLFLTMGKGSGSYPVLAFGIMGYGVYKFYVLLRHDLAPVFRIPFKKVVRIDFEGGTLSIGYLNAEDKLMDQAFKVPVEAGEFAVAMFRASRLSN